ncbi:MAG: FIVAR domain-containing protein, partial [Bacteroidales bacterium]|nr:FIVAR domain-containing protein [Bacteroidales bacterium]
EGRITVSKDAVPADEPEPQPTPEAKGAYVLTTTVSDGDQIVIYHPAQGMSLSTTLNGVKVDGVAVTVADKVLTPAETTAVYTVEFPEGDETNFYLKMADGTYLTSAPTGNGMSFEAEPNEYSLWYLQILDEAAGTVAVRSTNAAFNGNKNQALEFYKGYTTYGWKENNAAYIFQIYKFGLPVTNDEVVKTSLEAAITAAEALDLTAYTDESVANLQTALAAAREVLANEAATQDEVNAATAALNAAVEALVLKPIEASFTLASTLQTGDEVLLINPTNAKALDASMNGSYYLNGVDATITGTTATVASETAIWTVTVHDDGTYTFRNGENVLAAYVSGSYADLALTEADHTVNWVATASGDVFYLNAKDLSTSNGSIYLEWYNGRFSAYASSSPSAAAFGIQFFVKQ